MPNNQKTLRQKSNNALTEAQKNNIAYMKKNIIKNCVSILNGLDTTQTERDIIISILYNITIHHMGNYEARISTLEGYDMTLYGIFFSHNNKTLDSFLSQPSVPTFDPNKIAF